MPALVSIALNVITKKEEAMEMVIYVFVCVYRNRGPYIDKSTSHS